MSPEEIRTQFIAELEQAQSALGCTPVPITGYTCPLTDVPGMDSKTLPVVIALLADATGLAIPTDKSIFATAGRGLTVDEIVTKICERAKLGAAVA